MIKKRLIAMGLTICMLFGNTNVVFADSQIQSVPAVVEETQETIETSETTAEEEIKETEEPVVNQENDSQEEIIHNQQTELDINNELEAEKKTNEQITEEQQTEEPQTEEQQSEEQQTEEQQSEEQQSEEQQMNETMNDLQTEPEKDESADSQTDTFEENYAETELVHVEETITEMQEPLAAQTDIEQKLQTTLQTAELLAEETKNKIEPAAMIIETAFLSADMNAESFVSSVTAEWNNETVTLALGSDYTVEWKNHMVPTQIGDAVIVIKPVSGSNYSFEAIERTVAVCEVLDIKTVNQTYKIAPYTADEFIDSESKAKLEQYGYTASLNKDAKNPGNYTLTVKLTEDTSKYIHLAQNGIYTVKIEKGRTKKMEIELGYDSVTYQSSYSVYDTRRWIENVYAVFTGENGAVERKKLNTSTDIAMGEPQFYGAANTKLRFSVSRLEKKYGYGDLDCGNFILAGGSNAYGYVDVMLYCIDISTSTNMVYNGNEKNALSYLNVRYESGTALPKFKYTITDENGNTVSTSEIQDYADNIINKIKVKDVGTYNVELSVYKPDDLTSPYLTRSVSVTVHPKELQVNYGNAKIVTYDGSAYDVYDFFESAAINADDIVEGEEVTLNSGSLVDAGKNGLPLSLAGKDADNYILSSDTVEVEILPFEVSKLNVPVKGNRKYNGTNFFASDFITNSGITVADSAGNKLELNSDQYHICFDGMEAAKNKGQYTIVVTLTDTQNFSIENPIVEKTISISAADAQISFHSPTKPYGAADPAEYSLITENASLLTEAQETISDLRVSYRYDGSDAGSYVLKDLVIGDKSAAIPASEEANTEYCSIGNFRYYCKPDYITITKAKADLQVFMEHQTYNGSAFTADSFPCSIMLSGHALTEDDYTVEYDHWQNSFDSFDGEGPVNAGDYGVKFTITNPSFNKNFYVYEDEKNKEIITFYSHVTIDPYNGKLKVTTKDVTYDGKTHYPEDFIEKVEIVDRTDESRVLLTLSKNAEDVEYVLSFTDDMDTVKNAGTYSLTASLTKGFRYYESMAETDRETSIEMNIAKAAAKIDVSGVKTNYISNGKMQSITSGAKLNHDETYLVYSNNTFTTAEEGNGMKVMITAAETTNYLAAEASVTISVDQPEIPSGEDEKEEGEKEEEKEEIGKIEENSSTDDKKTSEHTNQILHTANAPTESTDHIDLTSSVVFDADYQPESFELQEVIVENEHQGNRLLIWTFPNENGVAEQRSLIFNAADLADLAITKDIEHLVFENGEAIVEWNVTELSEGNLPKLIARILNGKEEITFELLKQDWNMVEPVTITAEQLSLFQVEICIVPVETEGDESAYEVSFWLRWGDQKLNVSNLISSVTIGIVVDKLLNENNYDTFADVNTLVYQMNRKEEKGQEEPDSKVLDSRLLIMPEEETVTSYDSSVLFDLYRHYCLAADYTGDGIYMIMSNK